LKNLTQNRSFWRHPFRRFWSLHNRRRTSR